MEFVVALMRPLFFLGLMTLIFFGEGNVGSLFRHRAFIWPCLHLFISAGLLYHFQEQKVLL